MSIPTSVLYTDVCVWGRVRLPESDASRLAREVKAALGKLSNDTPPPPSCRLNSAWTKLYAFALPERCVIYDSRVAAAVTSILDPVMPRLSGTLQWRPFENLGTIPGRGGSRPRETQWRWPNGYGSCKSQIAANKLVRRKRDELNEKAATRIACRKTESATPWTLREVEAVLFMEGY